MDKYFLLVFSLLCFFEAVTPLKCTTCHLRTKTGDCRSGYGVCVAQENEKCMTLKIYRDGIFHLSYLLCQKFCRDLTVRLYNQIYVHECCDYNYCNFII